MTMYNEPPHNKEAEQSILGALLSDVNYGLCRQALDLLTQESFYISSHAKIFSLIKAKAESKQVVDLINITEALEVSGDIEFCGGFVYIAELIRNNISKSHILSYVELVNKYAATRSILKMSYQVIEQASNSSPSDLISFIDSSLKDIGSTQTGKSSFHISEFGENWLNAFEERGKQGGLITGLETGITDLDERLCGFDKESLIILAGRPSMGKTLLAQTILDNVGGYQQKTCQFFSMEMSDKQVYERFVSKASNVCAQSIRSAKNFSNEDWGRLNSGIQHVNKSKIYVDVDPKLSVDQIRARVRRQISKHGSLGLIVIDYLGLMKLPKADRHDIAIGEVTSALKNLAKEIQTPVLLLVQANRDLDKAKRPTMSNLKDSSSIEADADVVMFVHREEVNNPDTELKGVTELIIAKDRHNDGNGTVYLVKTNGGFNSMDEQAVAELHHKEETKNAPKRRGYAKQYQS